MKHVLLDTKPPTPSLPQTALNSTGEPIIDGFGRRVTYLRLSITDRCDLRCTYCMPERMKFVPKTELLSFEELDQLVAAFVARGVTKLRITGGEPLVRRDAVRLIEQFSRHLGQGLNELNLTTNGTQLARHAEALAGAGVARINVSLDSRDPQVFARLTRRDRLEDVLAGIRAATRAGIKVKINTVALATANAHELPDLINWAHGEGHDLSLIETMPLGEVDGDRSEEYISLQKVREDLSQHFTLEPVDHSTGGPSRYYRVAETGGLVGMITPISENFCANCNRVRVDCRGQLYACLGYANGSDLRGALRRESGADLDALLDKALGEKPERHAFDAARIGEAAHSRHMSHTGG